MPSLPANFCYWLSYWNFSVVPPQRRSSRTDRPLWSIYCGKSKTAVSRSITYYFWYSNRVLSDMSLYFSIFFTKTVIPNWQTALKYLLWAENTAMRFLSWTTPLTSGNVLKNKWKQKQKVTKKPIQWMKISSLHWNMVCLPQAAWESASTGCACCLPILSPSVRLIEYSYIEEFIQMSVAVFCFCMLSIFKFAKYHNEYFPTKQKQPWTISPRLLCHALFTYYFWYSNRVLSCCLPILSPSVTWSYSRPWKILRNRATYQTTHGYCISLEW